MKNKTDYSDILKKMLNCLYAIIVILVLNSILLIISIGDNQSILRTFSSSSGTGGSSTNDNSQQEELPYDVSQFIEMTTDEAMNAIGSSDVQVIYIGHESCGFCRRFVPVLQEAQDVYGYQTIYIDIDKVTSTDVEKWTSLDEYVFQNFGSTPLTILAKDGVYVDGLLGYVDYDTLKAFLEKNGFQAQ